MNPTPPQRATKPREENKGVLRDTVTTSGDKAARASPSRSSAVRAPRMSAQRNPSMFGAELPPVPVPATTTPPARVRAPLATRAPVLAAAVAAAAASSAIEANANARVTPASPARSYHTRTAGCIEHQYGQHECGPGHGRRLGHGAHHLR